MNSKPCQWTVSIMNVVWWPYNKLAPVGWGWGRGDGVLPIKPKQHFFLQRCHREHSKFPEKNLRGSEATEGGVPPLPRCGTFLFMLHWFQSCSTDFSHAPLISVMLHWFQSCSTDFSHAPLTSVMLHWFQSCSTDFSHAPLISVMLHWLVMLHWFQSCSTDFSHAPLISAMLHWFQSCFWHFYILKLLFLSIFFRYKWHACRLTCTDKFPNVPTKLWKVLLGGLR